MHGTNVKKKVCGVNTVVTENKYN